MSRHRFFLDAALDGTADVVAVPLSETDRHHAVDVLRVAPGEEIVVVEPGGRSLVVRLQSVRSSDLAGRVVGELPGPDEPRVTLLQGVIKGSRMDEIVQHAVELGVERVAPVVTAHTVVRLDSAKATHRVSRWQRIAEAAACQSQRTRVPVVESPTSLGAALRFVEDADLAVVLWEESDADGLASVLRDAGVSPAQPGARVVVVVGPEGGLTADEVDDLVAAGARVASLGGAILRAETAALAALTLVADALGALGSPTDAGFASDAPRFDSAAERS